jgi:hypothetical protein
VKNCAHAGAHGLRIAGIDAAGAQQTTKISEPGQRPQDGAEIAGILDLVQVDGALPACRGR